MSKIMKAKQLKRIVEETEDKIHLEIYDIIQEGLNKLSFDTELDINGITFELLEGTTKDSPAKEYLVGKISIEVSI